MRISECYAKGTRTFSFEFFPPNTEEEQNALFATIADLRRLGPSFVSVTYGAGGSTRERTIELTGRIRDELHLEAAAHLTCVGHSRAELDEIISGLLSRGVENVVALRGDPPKGQATFVPAPDGYRNAYQLVRHLRERNSFCIAVAGYPEGHPECPDLDQDLDHLKLKVDQGADVVITQLFFQNADYFRFVGRARAKGLTVPIVPGVMPIRNLAQIKRFTKMCGATIPVHLLAKLEAAGADADAVERIGTDYATEQCAELLRRGAPGIHFYTLNRSHATVTIFERLRAGGLT
ncbi:MAG: methylenetetrahydrofolate reductase [NAD(P)H] [Candidatus Schekmanbacteria bacterium]|nr:methylenetetrahydrofolate reductase [NAD(P)H] [Candidatus Schekmanbacteria bacterium]